LSKVAFQPIHQLHAWLTIAKDKELKLTTAQQQELRLVRQQELLVLEHEIIELQAALAVHSNELIWQVDAYCADYRATSAGLNATYENFQHGCLDATATGQLYACLITQERMLDRLRRKIQEICIIGDYYQRLSRTSGCIASSTSIIAQWEQVLPCIRLNTKWIDQDKKTCAQRMACVEDYFRRCSGSSISTFKNNLTKTVEKHLGSCDATCLAIAVNKLEAVTKEAKVTVQIPINAHDIDNDETDKVEGSSSQSEPSGFDMPTPPKEEKDKIEKLVDEAFKLYKSDKSKYDHLFGTAKGNLYKHGFDKLIDELIKLGKVKNFAEGTDFIVQTLLENVYTKGIPLIADMWETIVRIGSHDVTVRTLMVNGSLRIGTAFIEAAFKLYMKNR
jgi:hypothetical protein